jgi:hypothetical protein
MRRRVAVEGKPENQMIQDRAVIKLKGGYEFQDKIGLL